MPSCRMGPSQIDSIKLIQKSGGNSFSDLRHPSVTEASSLSNINIHFLSFNEAGRKAWRAPGALRLASMQIQSNNQIQREEVGCLLPLGHILMRQCHTAANYNHSRTDAFGLSQPPTVDSTHFPQVTIPLHEHTYIIFPVTQINSGHKSCMFKNFFC